MFSSQNSQVSSAANYIEDVFSTYLYTGNSSTQTITNGIDLAGDGGLVWLKGRSLGYNNGLFDTIRGADYLLCSNNTDPSTSISGIPANAWITGFNSDGFGLGSNGSANASGQTYASWTFREQPKFFDVVTYTGNGTNGRTVAHSLGSTPGCIIVKRTDAANGWAVYHRAMNASPQDYMMRLNATDGAFTTTPSRWNNTLPTSTEFTLSGNDEVNGSGATYVAYLFAHNAGGFGLSGADNVISCGSFTTNGSGTATVSLGYEPQMLIVKRTDATEDWFMVDNMRGWFASPSVDTATLKPNTSDAEFTWGAVFAPSATGFTYNYNPSSTYIYIAIRRGPMKVPTSGTSVFTPQTRTGTGSAASITGVGFPVDLVIDKPRTADTGSFEDRLRGSTQNLVPSSTGAESTSSSTWDVTSFASMDGIDVGISGNVNINTSGTATVNWFFRRAPSFFDEVCYTGTGTGSRAVTHNLGVVPEMVIVKQRAGTPDRSWWVLTTAVPLLNVLNSTEASNASGVPANLFGDATYNNYIAPTATTVTLSPSDEVNKSSNTYVAYLFATCAGVSKVGSYTGTGTTKQVDCGFTGGARFVLIKKTSGTGSWYIWDSARGIVSGNDPYLLLNSTSAEVTNTDYIDTYSAGFEISSTAPSEINENGGSFIFLAIS